MTKLCVYYVYCVCMLYNVYIVYIMCNANLCQVSVSKCNYVYHASDVKSGT